jgi:DNA-binding phage protein
MEEWREHWRSRLRKAIDLTRRSQASIALQAGVTPETLSRVLSGVHAQPAFETVVSIIYAAGETSHGFCASRRRSCPPTTARGCAKSSPS